MFVCLWVVWNQLNRLWLEMEMFFVCVIFSSKIFVDIPKSKLVTELFFQVFGHIMVANIPFAEVGTNRTETQAAGMYILGLCWKKIHRIL